ncbi:hypothetical protein [Sinomonas atrocyanea]|uniref:hypothetical protein n=1 Tax=Sinomonas atrocyanea TaxID=37927 RepID=UPI0028606036|nr:hypothetical protein [Sinomonas atrocyanea]MDR6621071.1 hypothetical protein [Sinomonas atrocyanea]
MSDPRWDDKQLKVGTMARAALWLLQVVGEGNAFTKEQLRIAFPGVSQADRRVRDLRDYGWVLDTSVSDATLARDEQRFVRRGVDVWVPSLRRAVEFDSGTVSNKEREAVFAANGYQCVSCGIAGGEAYPDRPSETAVLAVSRRTMELLSGRSERVLVPECKRCKSGTATRTYSIPEVRALLEDLAAEDLRRIRRWALKGVRGTTSLDRAWNGLRTLPANERRKLLDLFD